MKISSFTNHIGIKISEGDRVKILREPHCWSLSIPETRSPEGLSYPFEGVIKRMEHGWTTSIDIDGIGFDLEYLLKSGNITIVRPKSEKPINW